MCAVSWVITRFNPCVNNSRVVSLRVVSLRVVSLRGVSLRGVSLRVVSLRGVSLRVVSLRVVSPILHTYCAFGFIMLMLIDNEHSTQKK